MGLAAGPVRRKALDRLCMRRERAWTTPASTSRYTTHVAQTNTGIDHLSTNRASYPQVRTPYPHLAHRGSGPPYPLLMRVFSDRAGHRPIVGAGPHTPSRTPSRRIGVEHLAKGPDIAAEDVVLAPLPLHLFAAVQHRPVGPTNRNVSHS